MIKSELIVCLLFSVFTVFAQQQDEKAKSILAKVTENTQSFKTIKCSFSYVMDNKSADIHEVNNGTMLMEGEKYYLKIPKMGIEVYRNEKTVWNYMSDANEVTINNTEDSSDAIDPSTLFSFYNEGFIYHFTGEKNNDGKSLYIIDLTPEKGKEKACTEIRLFIDKKKMLVKEAILKNEDGNNYIITISDMKTNVPVKESDFVFEAGKHPGAEVVDLR
ncbi:MAG: outer membrane lipoprotein carrier protein LolA [Prolixibacteraceae bacterium]|nr:outer membrane lipoprotein carrier protein LolA [Prolixibacteraceae bacterium]